MSSPEIVQATSPRLSWIDPRLRAAWLIAGLLLIVWALSWPQLMINGDEYLYAGQARTLLHGHVIPHDGDPLPAPLANPGSILRYPLGWSLLLAPASLLGFRAMFVLPLVFHLFGVLVFARLLVRRGISAWFCIVWTLWPPLLPFVRTLMTDAPTAALFLYALDAWEEDRFALAGALLGWSITFRVAAIFPAAGFAMVACTKRPRAAILFLGSGIALGVIGILAGNQLMHGDPLRSQYSESGLQSLRGSHLVEHTLLYVGALILFPPFPLVCCLLSRARCERWVFAIIPPLLFAVAYDYQDKSTRFVETLVGGQRMMLSAHAILLIATSRVWAFPWLERFRRFAPVLATLGFAASIVLTRHLYERYRPAVDQLRACHPESIAYNTSASRVALSVDAKTYRFAEERDPRGLADIAVYARRAPTNQVVQSTFVQPLPDTLKGLPCVRAGEFWIFDNRGTCLPREASCLEAFEDH